MNRSIGPDQDDRDPADAFYLHSLKFPVPGAFDGQAGVFRSPAALPSSWIVLSCDQAASDLTRGNFDFDLCALQPETGALVGLLGEAARAEIEAVAVYARTNHGVFQSRPDEANSNTRIEAGANDAQLHILDTPLLATLLFNNTRIGRRINPDVGGLDVLESLPPDPALRSFAELPTSQVVDDDHGQLFVRYDELGHAGLQKDGSVKLGLPAGHPFLLRLTDKGGAPLMFEEGGQFTGTMTQREESQLYPGERANTSFRRPLFNAMCGGCHGSITGYELDIAVKADVLTSASLTDAHDQPAAVLR